ncbi:MAG: cytochrome c3 family protein [Deferribacteres bacterium]|nr:cytochrome c3 family protein [candidate division KSB1 bacterium]MCB9500974.1 cytochrome c3 family protein [Deferribacteres bacterium]
MKKILICLGISLSCAFTIKAQDFVEIENSECFDCHNDPEIQEDATDSTQVLFVDEEKFTNSIHGDLYCTECHTDVTDTDHEEDLAKVKCANCHEDSEEDIMASVHGRLAMQEYPEDLPKCSTCHGTHYIAEVADTSSWMSSVNQVKVCKQCHGDASMIKRHNIAAESPIENYIKDVHGKLAASGDENAAACSNCHGGHKMLPHTDPNSTINRLNLATTCGECHEEQTEQYLISKHAKSLQEGSLDAPACNDCHLEHHIISKNDPMSPTATVNVSLQICSPCHASERLMNRYGLLTDRVTSYENSYHGLALRGGKATVANCGSCHGVHAVLPESDPRSMINPNNLAATCGECHPNASENFANSKIHLIAGTQEMNVLSLVEQVYIWLIFIVIGFMLVHNSLDFYIKSKHIRSQRYYGR